MSHSSRSLFVIALSSLAASIAFCGRASAPPQQFQHPSREPRAFGTAGPQLIYLVLGDSTAAGQGGNYENGIAVATARELGKSRRVVMTNLAVSGARTGDVLDRQLRTGEALKPDVVLLSVGANDVTHLTSIASVRKSLRTIVGRLEAANPAMAIVVTGSPDMGTAPRIPRLLRPIAGWRTEQVNEMFEEVARESGLTFAPIAKETGPLFRRDRSLFDSDLFHPNDRGYATWIPVLNAALAEALAGK